MLKFKKKIKKPEEVTQTKKVNWLKILIISNISLVIVIGIGIGSMVLIHQSDTNPNLCATCHIMQPNVGTYLSGNTLDNVHKTANVQCKDCHNYPVVAEISSGINFLIGNYEVDSSGMIIKRAYKDEMCLKCHISNEYIADATDFLFRNPHNSHWGILPCNSCHISHGDQIDYCSSCHDNGGQRMTGQIKESRGKIGPP